MVRQTFKVKVLIAWVVSSILMGAWFFLREEASTEHTERASAAGAHASRPTSERPPLRSLRSNAEATPVSSAVAPTAASSEGLVSGWVVDAADKPVSGAQVTLDQDDGAVESGPDGYFSFDDVPEGRHWLRARSGERAAGPVLVLADFGERETILRLRAAPSLEVKVVDAQTGRAIPGARVEVRAASPVSGVTKADGLLLLSELPPGHHALVARANGYAPERVTLTVPDTDAGRLRRVMALGRGVLLSGRVVDAAGRAVQGAEVSAQEVGELGATDPVRDAGVSDSAGEFRLRVPAHAEYRVTARDAAHAPQSLAPVAVRAEPISGLLLRLSEGARLAGVVVTDAGDAVPFARVSVVPWGGGYSTAARRETVADDRGEFEVAGLPRAWSNLVATTEGASSYTLSFDLVSEPERRGLRIVVENGGRITGRVVDGHREPVSGVRVVVDRKGASSGDPDGQSSTVLTDESGAFALAGLAAASRYRLQAVPAGVAQAGISEARTWLEAGVGDDVKLELPDDGAVRGAVLFEDGEAPREFTVSVAQGMAAPFVATNGQFALDRAAPGPTTLRISGPSFATRIVEDVMIEAELATDVGTIVVQKGAALSGRVVASDGGPVADATVLVSRKLVGNGTTLGADELRADHSIRSARSGSDGSFTVTGLTSDARLVVAAEHEELGKSQLATITTGPALGALELVLEAPGRASGVVTVLGAPAEGVMLSLGRADQRGDPLAALAVTTGPAGDYAFPSVPAGQYSLFAVRRIGESDIDAKRVEVTIAPGGETRTDFDLRRGASTLIVSVPIEGDSEDGETPRPYYTAVLHADTAQVRDLAPGEPAEFKDLEEGAYELCVYRLTTQGPRQEPARGTPSCQPVRVTRASGPQTVTVALPRG